MEVEPEQFAQVDKLAFTDAAADLADCNVYVVTVPTPVAVRALGKLRSVYATLRTRFPGPARRAALDGRRGDHCSGDSRRS